MENFEISFTKPVNNKIIKKINYSTPFRVEKFLKWLKIIRFDHEFTEVFEIYFLIKFLMKNNEVLNHNIKS